MELTLLILIGYGIPIAAAVWALFTLYKIRTAVELMHHRLEAVERLLQRPSSS
jgi:hypothetical protein